MKVTIVEAIINGDLPPYRWVIKGQNTEIETLLTEGGKKDESLTEIRKLCGDWLQGASMDGRPQVVINAAYQIANLELNRASGTPDT